MCHVISLKVDPATVQTFCHVCYVLSISSCLQKMKSFVNIRKLTSNLNKLGLFKVLLWHEFQNRNRTLKVEIILLKQNTAGDFDSRLFGLYGVNLGVHLEVITPPRSVFLLAFGLLAPYWKL